MADDIPKMDWSSLKLEGQYFGMPRYRDKWQGDEEWIVTTSPADLMAVSKALESAGELTFAADT